MREIEGIVCTARTKVPVKQEMLFGPNTGGSMFNHQRFTTNELTPFTKFENAKQALSELRRRSNLFLVHTGFAEIAIKLTATDNEWQELAGQNNYIIVARFEGGYELLGAKVEKIPGVAYAPVSILELNGFKTINNFDRLTGNFGIVYEVRRQGQPYSAQIATFKMKRLKSK